MADEKNTWKRFRRLKFDSRTISRRAKRAETTSTRHAHKFVLSKLDSLRSSKQLVIGWLLLISILIAGVGLQMFWYQKAYRTEAWKSGGTYAEAVLGPVNTLNPLYATSDAELSASKLLFSSLYSYDKTGNLSDDLASSLSISGDGRQYTVTIREDANWSDGIRLTADDIIFTVGLMKSEEVRSVMYGNWVDIDARALDTRTVQFTLPAQYASFQHALSFPILPKHILENVPPGAMRQNTFSVSPIGSGPFTVRFLKPASDERHKIVNLSASEKYYRGAPRLTRFELHSYEDQDSMTRAVQTGEVNAAAGIEMSAGDLPSTFTAKQYPVNSGVYALFNSDTGILKDESVRRALQVGTDTSALRKSVGYPVPPLHLPFTNGQLSGVGIPEPPTYDVNRASKLLSDAGWKLPEGGTVRMNKRKQPLELSVITVKNSSYEKVLEQLAGQWRRIGISVKTEIRDPDSPTKDFVQTTLQPRNYNVLLYELVIGADPDVYAYWHSSQSSRLGYNFANYRSSLSDDILSTARSSNDPLLRNEKYKAFAQKWLEDAPAIGIYQSVLRYAHRNSVKPAIESSGMPTENDRYSSILYWSAEKLPVYKTP